MVPKVQHAFSQLTADGRFAVLGLMLSAALGSVSRIVGLLHVYEELGEEETRKVLDEFAAEGWGEDEGLGVLVPRKTEKTAEDLGEVLKRYGSDEDDDHEHKLAAKKTEKELRTNESGCLALERDVLEQSRKSLEAMSTSSSRTPLSEQPSASAKAQKKLIRNTKTPKRASQSTSEPEKQTSATPVTAASEDDDTTSSRTAAASTTNVKPRVSKEPAILKPSKLKSKTKRSKEDEPSSATQKPLKKKKKKNAIDDLFNF